MTMNCGSPPFAPRIVADAAPPQLSSICHDHYYAGTSVIMTTPITMLVYYVITCSPGAQYTTCTCIKSTPSRPHP